MCFCSFFLCNGAAAGTVGGGGPNAGVLAFVAAAIALRGFLTGLDGAGDGLGGDGLGGGGAKVFNQGADLLRRRRRKRRRRRRSREGSESTHEEEEEETDAVTRISANCDRHGGEAGELEEGEGFAASLISAIGTRGGQQ